MPPGHKAGLNIPQFQLIQGEHILLILLLKYVYIDPRAENFSKSIFLDLVELVKKLEFFCKKNSVLTENLYNLRN